MLTGLHILTTVLLAAGGYSDDQITARQQDHMGTYVSITIAAPESDEVLAAVQAGYAEVERLEKLLSEWREDSRISEVNRQAGIKPVPVPPELYKLVKQAHDISVQSQGAFDVTHAAMAGLWNYKAKNPKVPGTQAIQERVKLVDYRKLELKPEDHSVMLKHKGMRIGLGGIAKGYVMDRVSRVLKEQGYPNHLVIAGGDLYASGTRGNRKWRIGIRDPKSRGLHAVVEVEDEGVATSGNYEKFFYQDGVRYHHILDPKTGRPARGTSSLTVIAKSAAEADAYATALFVLGGQKALDLAGKKGLEVFLFDESFKTAGTPGMLSRVKKK